MTDNSLHLDEDSVRAELPPIPGAATAAPLPGVATAAVAGDAPATDAIGAWGDVSTLTVDIIIKGLLCPNWTVEDPPRQSLVDAIAGVLNDLMPGGLAMMDSWGPYGKLAFALGGLVMANTDMRTLRVKPMKVRPPKAAPEAKVDPDIVIVGTAAQAPAVAPKKTGKKRSKKRSKKGA